MQLLCTLWVIFTGALLWTVFCLKGILTLSLLIKLHPPVTWWIRCTYLEQEGLQPAKLSSTLSTLSSPLPPHPEEGTLPGQSHQATPSADFPLTTHPQGSAQLRGWWGTGSAPAAWVSCCFVCGEAARIWGFKLPAAWATWSGQPKRPRWDPPPNEVIHPGWWTWDC